jgi:hypothetical protein
MYGIVPVSACRTPTSIGTEKILQPSKLLQRHSTYGYLVQTASGDLMIFQGETLNWLQHIETTTAECYRTADQRTNSRTIDDFFESSTKGDCTDSASGIIRCEDALGNDYPDTKRIRLPCELHIGKNGQDKTFSLMKDRSLLYIYIYIYMITGPIWDIGPKY